MSNYNGKTILALTYEQLKDIYDRIVDGMRYEEELIGRRIGWMLAIQGVVLAAAGALVMQDPTTPIQSLPLLKFVLFITGSASALITGAGVLASKMAADFYRTQLWQLAEDYPVVKQFPAAARMSDPTHNGRSSVLIGRLVDCGLPWLVWGGWLALSTVGPFALHAHRGVYPAVLFFEVMIGLTVLAYYGYVWLGTRNEESWRTAENRLGFVRSQSPASLTTPAEPSTHGLVQGKSECATCGR